MREWCLRAGLAGPSRRCELGLLKGVIAALPIVCRLPIVCPQRAGFSEPVRASIAVKTELLSYNERLEARSASGVDVIVVHCTELPTIEMARNKGEEVMYPSRTGYSGHYYIDKEGTVVQFVEVHRVAHHVAGHNARSIGIELVNEGRYPRWHHSLHQKMSTPYPAVQLASLLRLVADLRRRHPSIKYIARHEDLDTRLVPSTDNPSVMIRRKVDPGPMFPWPWVVEGSGLQVFGQTKHGRIQ